ncbi:penicillin-binding protein [Saccharopolyspora erythraea]|uniref:transglycosylase domain-containing protein n=1 Tax=Saccharopolyspora erythraea TaxID=1836 RepID=UPI001BA76660|nr:transglycosylase domain-containing protein [Saccharopolyspora erythraea]QUG99742.1 penicillin-binding protein [Saccharopolyspora erythraea]
MSDDATTVLVSAARRRRRLRRVLRAALFTATALLLGAVGAFAAGYAVWEVPDPRAVATGTQQSIVLQYSDGTEMTRIVPGTGNRTMIGSLDEVSPAMRQATLAAEDASFYSNGGFDVLGIVRAAYAQVTNSPGGGSTLTQQYIKLATGEDEHSYTRKFKEIVLAAKMTNEQPKDEIFKAYLNTAYYGRGAWGVHAAANAYFGKPPRDLDASEAAVLAGVVQKPTENDPRVNAAQAAKRWEYVAGQMLANHMITGEQRRRMAVPETRERFAWRGEEMSGPLFHIRERVLEELERDGLTARDLHRDGNTVVTNIDRDAQRAAEETVAAMAEGRSQNLRSALVSIEPGTGAIRAYHSGDRRIGGFDWARAAQPPGAAMQPFVVAAGLMRGHGLAETYDGTSPQEIMGATYRNSGVDCSSTCTARMAMAEAAETAFVNMAARFGPAAVLDAAQRAGMRVDTGDDERRVGLGIATGDYPVSTVDLARAYATLAAGGADHEPRFVRRVLDRTGNEVRSFEPEPRTAFGDDPEASRDVAGNVTESLRRSAWGTSWALDGRRPVAVKSGIAQFGGSPDKALTAWTAGYTPQIATAVSLSASDERGRPQPVVDATSSQAGDALTGPTWQRFMNAYLADEPVEPFPDFGPVGRYAEPSGVPFPPVSTSVPPPPRVDR